MALSAADLQKRHELEGAPDPFPSFADSTPVKARNGSTTQALDTESQSAFPSLAPTSGNVAPSTAWGSGPRIKPAVNKQPLVTDSFTLPNSETAAATNKDGKPVSLGEVMKQVMSKFKVKLEASGNQKTSMTTFHIKSESTKELEKAKRLLLAQLSPVITSVLQAPASTIPSVIGPKGATLKQIRDQTNVKIDIPKREEIPVAPVNGAGSDEEEEEPSVPITVSGPRPLVLEAQNLLKQIIAQKTSKTTQRVKDIPPHILPFVIARRPVFIAAAEGSDVKLTLNQATREISVHGEREAVARVIETLKSNIEQLTSGLTAIKVNIPKRQHRLLSGTAAESIMTKAKCSVTVTGPNDPSEEVSVWGLPADLPAGLQAVMEQASSRFIKDYQLPGPISTSRQLLTYLSRSGYIRNLNTSRNNVSVHAPDVESAGNLSSISVDIVGEKSAVEAVHAEVAAFIGKLSGSTREVTVDWLVHKIIIAKQAKKIKQFHDSHNVSVYFPAESAELSAVLLVYDPLTGDASADKKHYLDEVEKELIKIAKEVADVKTVTLSVEKRWHDAIIGEGKTTLNAIIGEDRTLSIKVGADAADPSGEDVVIVRGAAQDVERATKEVLKIVEDAKNDVIVSSYVTEFEIEREYVGRIVGAQGAGINKLRDVLGVKVDVSDEVDEKDSGKKKKAIHHHSRIKITGRKENVEEAKRRIQAQVERLADETTEVLKIPAQYHSSLIGQAGKYAIRLEDKYSVKITFPRQSGDDGKTREQLKADEVMVKGGRKGVAGAKSELLEAVEFEKESNNVLKFTIPNKSVARVLGRGGASINEIKDNTDAQIDIDKSSDDSAVTNVTVRGTKKAVAAAKTAILAISDQIAEETTLVVNVEQKFHRSLIGGGGQGLRDLASRCGIEADSKTMASLIRFPRQGEPGDEVKLRGSPAVVNKLKAELEKVVQGLRDRVVLGVSIPAVQHKALIGRGGQHLNDLQSRTGAQVQFPGSRSYGQVGAPENADELKDTAPEDMVKVSGPRAACEKAITELKAIKPAAPEPFVGTLTVPLKYHHAISQQGNFFRTLRSFGVSVDQSSQPSKSAVSLTPPNNGSAARIDEHEDNTVQWEVVVNYQDAEEGDSTWTLKARDQAGLDRAIQLAKEAIEHAKNMAYVGYLTLPDRTLFPRIVGSKGANVSRLRQETGADITVSRDTSVIVIMGAEADIVSAKDAIVKMMSDGPRRRQ